MGGKRVIGSGRVWAMRAMRAMSLAVFLVPCLLGVTACDGGSVHLSKDDDGKTVSVAAGDEVVVTLDENPTTGYVWAIDKIDDQVLALNSSDYTSDAPVPGSGGTRTLTFTTKQAGTSPLDLKDWRSWEGDKSIIGRFSVTIKVTSGS